MQMMWIALAMSGGFEDSLRKKYAHSFGAGEIRYRLACPVEGRAHDFRCVVVEEDVLGRNGFHCSLPNCGRERSAVSQSPKPEGVSVMRKASPAEERWLCHFDHVVVICSIRAQLPHPFWTFATTGLSRDRDRLQMARACSRYVLVLFGATAHQ